MVAVTILVRFALPVGFLTEPYDVTVHVPVFPTCEYIPCK
jgi:hypothetical protein